MRPNDGYVSLAQWNLLSHRAPIDEPPPHVDDTSGSSGGIRIGDSNNDPTTQTGNPDSAPVHIGQENSKGPDNSPPVRIGSDSGKGPDDSPPPPPPPPPPQIDYLGSLIGDSKDYDTLAGKGRSVDDDLHGTIDAGSPDLNIAQLTDNYEFKRQDNGLVLKGADDLKDAFDIINVDLSTAKQTLLEVISKGGQGSKSAVAEGEFFGDYGTIVGEARFKQNDQNPNDQQMRPSDITFSMWQKVASNKNTDGRQMFGTTDNVNKFRNFVGRNIQSKSTVETMITAHKNTGQPLDKPGVFKRTDTDPTKQTAFQAMLGTDFISSITYMVKDHHVALGDIHITEIHTFPRAYDPAAQAGRQKAAILVMFDKYQQ